MVSSSSASSSFLRLLAQEPRRAGTSDGRASPRLRNIGSFQKGRQRRWVVTVVAVRACAILIVTCAVGAHVLYYLGRSATVNDNASSMVDVTHVRNNHRNSNRIDANIITPFTSHPPDPIAIDVAGDVRHACLQHIRKRQASLLQPYFANASSVLLVDPAYHSNVGDHMITIGELVFLHGRAAAASVSQCSYSQAGDYVPKCDSVLQNELQHAKNKPASSTARKVAVWHGGGNFGDLWPLAQEPRIQSFTPLLQAGYLVLTMPNSWYYSNMDTEANDIRRIRDNIAAGLGVSSMLSDRELAAAAKERVIFSWREHVSYERGVEHFSFATNLLVPDIAFQLGPYRSIPPARVDAATDILLLLRDDHESVYAAQRNRQAIRDVLQSVPGAEQLTYSIVDWDDRLYRFESTDIFFTDTAVQLLSLGRVVICDRLHAAILAYLSGLPFIYLDQRTGKIIKTLTVAMESGESCQKDAKWTRAHNLTDAVEKAVEFLEQYRLKGLTREHRRDRLRKKRNQNASLL